VPGKYPYTEAMTHLARAVGAARSGDPVGAQKDVERIAALSDQLRAAKNDYWVNEVEVMRLASVAWIALAQNNADEALVLMRQAADMEDKSEKNIVTPGRLLPARDRYRLRSWPLRYGTGTYSTDGRVRVGCWKRAMNWYTSSGISVLIGNPRDLPSSAVIG
jgi:hypothetical protein